MLKYTVPASLTIDTTYSCREYGYTLEYEPWYVVEMCSVSGKWCYVVRYPTCLDGVDGTDTDPNADEQMEQREVSCYVPEHVARMMVGRAWDTSIDG